MMAAKNNFDTEQSSLFGLYSLQTFQKDLLEASVYRYFREHIFPNLDVSVLNEMYSSNTNTRPSCDLRVMLGAFLLAIEENVSIDRIEWNVSMNTAWRYALWILEEDRRPFCRRTLTRFMSKIKEEMDKNGRDLIKEIFDGLTAKIVSMDNADLSRIRIDSTMISSYVRNLSRFELIYLCNFNLAAVLHRHKVSFPENLAHYLEKGDRNRVCYHEKESLPYNEKCRKLLSESAELLGLTPEKLRNERDYSNLSRALNEQAAKNSAGEWEFKKSRRKQEDSSSVVTLAEADSRAERKKKQLEKSGSKENTEKSVSSAAPSPEDSVSGVKDASVEAETASQAEAVGCGNTMETAPVSIGKDGESVSVSVTAAAPAAVSCAPETTGEDGKDEDAAVTSEEEASSQEAEMNASILQTPADPDATYRMKYGDNVGYAGFWAESPVRSANGASTSYVVYYQMEKNTYSDAAFGNDLLTNHLNNRANKEETVEVVGDGAFTISEELAKESNVTVYNTNLTGRKPDEFLAGFTLSADKSSVESCPMNVKPVKVTRNEKTGRMTAHFRHSDCRNCKYFAQCHPTEQKKDFKKELSAASVIRAQKAVFRSTDKFKEISAFRNGTEAMPSRLKNYYNVNKNPRRGLSYQRICLGLAFMTSNAFKHCKYVIKDKCLKTKGDTAPKTA